MWIVESTQDIFKELYLYDYAAGTKEEVGSKVLNAAAKEGFRGGLQERLKDLHWKIVEVQLIKPMRIS